MSPTGGGVWSTLSLGIVNQNEYQIHVKVAMLADKIGVNGTMHLVEKEYF